MQNCAVKMQVLHFYVYDVKNERLKGKSSSEYSSDIVSMLPLGDAYVVVGLKRNSPHYIVDV